MEIKGRLDQRILLFSLVALIGPTVVFPAQFGTQLARGSLINVLYELVYYSFVIFLFHRRGRLLQLAQSAGICLIYRLGLGALFGVLIAAMYSMGLKVSVTLGMASYLPALLFHTAVTPFILKPVLEQLYRPASTQREPLRTMPRQGSIEHGRTSIAVSREHGVSRQVPAEVPPVGPPDGAASTAQSDIPRHQPASDFNGFERAVRYIGENGSVHLAAVVDSEGLLMAGYKRGVFDTEEWAPLALLFLENSQQVLRSGDLGAPEKLDILFENKRVSVARDGHYSLLVVSERQADDVLSIRINQAIEIVKKYVAERYGAGLNLNLERTHVSSIE